MISDVELDRIIGAWLAEGSDRAPTEDVDRALAIVASTPQSRRSRGRSRGGRWLLAAAVIALLTAGLAVGIGSGFLRFAPDQPTPSTDSSTLPPAVTGATDLRAIDIEDWSVDLGIPATWSLVPEADQGFDFRHFSGSRPEGHLSVNHESPYSATICIPRCHRIELPAMIPYSADIQFDALKTGVASITGSSTWTPLTGDRLPEVVRPLRQETTVTASDGRTWRRVVIVGLRDRNAVAIAWSQPEADFDRGLLDRVLADLELPSAPVYSDGDLVEASAPDGTFSLPLPGHWITPSQPELDGVPISGLYQFGEGSVLISIGAGTGTFGWCDPDCRMVADQTSLDALESTLREGGVAGPATPMTLDGTPARVIVDDVPVPRRYVLAIHDGRPVAIRLDVGDWIVAPGVVDQMLAGFRFAESDPPGPVEQVVVTSDGSAQLGLSRHWQETVRTDEIVVLELGPRQLMIAVEGPDGTVLPCLKRAGPWERCLPVRARDLDGLAAAVEPLPEAEPGIALPIVRRDEGVLGGEPAVIIRITAYEHPGRGGQEVVYVVAMHHGRPCIVRLRTSSNEFGDIEPILAGFRFLD